MRAVLVALLLSVSGQEATQEALRLVVDFAAPEAAQSWQAVNDRTKPRDLDIQAGDTLVARVKGDGREYVLNIYTKSRRMAFSYRAPLPTKKGEWTEVSVPLADFIPTAFGRRVQGMGPVEPDQINGLGFMLSDKQAGPFELEVGWVKAVAP